jgi:hypothetical protein
MGKPVTRSEVVTRALAKVGIDASGNRADDEAALLGLLVDAAREPALLERILMDVPDAEEIKARFDFAVAPTDTSGIYLNITQPRPIAIPRLRDMDHGALPDDVLVLSWNGRVDRRTVGGRPPTCRRMDPR